MAPGSRTGLQGSGRATSDAVARLALEDGLGEFFAGHPDIVEQILGGDTFTFCYALEVLPGVLGSATLVVEQEDVGTVWS